MEWFVFFFSRYIFFKDYAVAAWRRVVAWKRNLLSSFSNIIFFNFMILETVREKKYNKKTNESDASDDKAQRRANC